MDEPRGGLGAFASKSLDARYAPEVAFCPVAIVSRCDVDVMMLRPSRNLNFRDIYRQCLKGIEERIEALEARELYVNATAFDRDALYAGKGRRAVGKCAKLG